jgi:hypothetical protein
MEFVDRIKSNVNVVGDIPLRLRNVISEFEGFKSIYLSLVPIEVRINNFSSCFESNGYGKRELLPFDKRGAFSYRFGETYDLSEPKIDVSNIKVLDFKCPRFLEIKSYEDGVSQLIKFNLGLDVQKTDSLLKSSHPTDRVMLLLSSLDEYVNFANLQNKEKEIEKNSMLAFVVAGDRYF